MTKFMAPMRPAVLITEEGRLVGTSAAQLHRIRGPWGMLGPATTSYGYNNGANPQKLGYNCYKYDEIYPLGWNWTPK